MSKTYAIGIDMNNTKTTIGIVDAQGNIINKKSISSDYENIAEYIDAIYNHLSSLIEEQGGRDKIIGIGMAAPDSNYFTGCLEFTPDHKWKGSTPITQILSDNLQLPITLTNNANAAAIGELEYGLANGLKDFILISLDDEVSRGTVANGEIIHGHKLFSGKTGHINLHNKRGRICNCGRKDCLEAYCSTDGLVTTALELLSTNTNDSILRNIPQQELTFEHIFEASTKGDKLAKETYLFTAHLIGQVLSDLIAYSSPKAFIFSGKIAMNNEFFIQAIRTSFESNLMDVYKGKTKIVTSKLNHTDSIILGSSLLVLKSEFAEA